MRLDPALGEKCGAEGEFRWAAGWQPLFKLIQLWDSDPGKIRWEGSLEGDMYRKKSAAVAVRQSDGVIFQSVASN